MSRKVRARVVVETPITRTEFMGKMTGSQVVQTECDGCCNVMRFHLAHGEVLEIESIAEDGVYSMCFYTKVYEQERHV